MTLAKRYSMKAAFSAILLAICLPVHAAVVISLDIYVDDVVISGGDGSVLASDLGLLGHRFDFLFDVGRVDEFSLGGGVPVDQADLTSPVMNYFGTGTLAANGTVNPVESIALEASGIASGAFTVGGEIYNVTNPGGGSALLVNFFVPLAQAVTSPVTVIDFLQHVTHWDGTLAVALSGPGGYSSNLELSLTSTPVPLPATLYLLLGAIGGLLPYGRFRRGRGNVSLASTTRN